MSMFDQVLSFAVLINMGRAADVRQKRGAKRKTLSKADARAPNARMKTSRKNGFMA